MEKVFRVDTKSKITKVVKTDEGFLQVTAPIARTGVYEYRQPDGSIQREYIPPTTLFNQDSMSTLQLKPVTNQHPQDFVTVENAGSLIVGSVGQNFLKEDDKLVTDFIINQKEAIDAVLEGREELSPGYDCELDFTSGITPEGERYDAIQINRKYNHLALVDFARGGNDISMRLDGIDTPVGVQIEKREDSSQNNEDGGCGMDKIQLRVDGLNVSFTEAELQARMDTLAGDLSDALTANGELETKLTSAEARADEATEQLTALKEKGSDEALAKKVDARVELISTARSICGEDKIKTTDSEEDIQKAIILAISPNAKLDGKDADYIAARCDAAIEMANDDTFVASQNRQQIRNHEDGIERKDSRSTRIDKYENAHKGDK